MTRKLLVFVGLVLLFSASLLAQAQTRPSGELETRINLLLKQLTLEEKIDLIGGVDDFYIREVPHIGLPRLKMADGPLGVRNYGPSTTFGGIALAATWDLELARQVGAIIGQDARARGVHILLGPGVNIYRAPLCGRNFEYLGEDPFLASRLAVAYIRGLQDRGVSATIKHYMGNNSEYDRNHVDSMIEERTMREIYLPVFEAAVKEAHVGAIMDSYNLTNGKHMTQNGYLNIEVARKDWGFDGIIMSDWDATHDGVAAANGGLDLEMPSGKFMNRATLLPAVKSGKVTENAIDDKVRRILRTAMRFGWLDHDQTDLSIPRFNQQGDEVALEGARSSMVLLKNSGNLLPLAKSRTKSIAIIGPDAYPGQPTGGGSAEVRPFFPISYLEGLTNYIRNDAKVYYELGLPTLSELAKTTEFTTEASGTPAGLKLEAFSNSRLSGKARTAIEKHVNYRPESGSALLQGELSARWTGYFTPKAAGEHLIFVQGPGEGGGYRLFVDGKLVIDNWTQAKSLISQVRASLSAEPHTIRLEYFVDGGSDMPDLRLGIVPPGSLVNAEAKSLASRADAVIVAVGFDPGSESEGSDRSFQLPPGQDELINEMARVNKNTIVVVTSGGAVDMHRWLDHVPALFEAWYGGQQAGLALAQLLFGDYSPSGKLPVSFESVWEDNAVFNSYYPNQADKKVAYSEGIFLGYRHFDKTGIKPLFPFGFGLSYTSFAYKNLSISPSRVSGDSPAIISFDLTNTGRHVGAEVAEIYVGEEHPPLPRPMKELKGFAKVALDAGQTKHVSVILDRRAFSYYDAQNHRWTADAGQFDIYVGPSETQAELTGKITRE